MKKRYVVSILMFGFAGGYMAANGVRLASHEIAMIIETSFVLWVHALFEKRLEPWEPF